MQDYLYIRKAIIHMMAFLLLILVQSHAIADESSDNKQKQSHHIYFSLSNQHGSPLKQSKELFDCSDKIYTVVELKDYPQGKYHLSVRWKNPSGATQEHTQYDFHVKQQHTRLWAWLSLSRAKGAGMLQFINPSAGLDEFIGVWQVEVRIDDRLVDQGNFEVSC